MFEIEWETSASNIRKRKLAGPGNRLYVGGFCCIKVRDAVSSSWVGWCSWGGGVSRDSLHEIWGWVQGLWCPCLKRSRGVTSGRGWCEPPAWMASGLRGALPPLMSIQFYLSIFNDGYHGVKCQHSREISAHTNWFRSSLRRFWMPSP